jgi:hypothetical protein
MDFNGDYTPDQTLLYGSTGDIGVAGDFNGDTITEIGFYRKGTGTGLSIWHINLYNDNTNPTEKILSFGGAADKPVVGDFDGDGKYGIGTYRPSNGIWYFDNNLDGAADGPGSIFGGLSNDVPVVGDFDGDGRAERAIFRNVSGKGVWLIDSNWDGMADLTVTYGLPTDIPYAADFNGDGYDDLCIFRKGNWYVDTNRDGNTDMSFLYGQAGERPIAGFFNTASSLFVRAGATGTQDGSQKKPYSTINTALSHATTGSVIRIAAGTYPEIISFSNRAKLVFLGTGPKSTHIVAATYDALQVVISTGIALRNIHIKSISSPPANGRAIVNKGSSVSMHRVSTVGNRQHNILGDSYLGTNASFDMAYCTSDQSQIGAGMQLQSGVTTNARYCSFSNNGTDSAHLIADAGGRGIDIRGTNSSATILYCNINNNYFGGLYATSNANMILSYNTIKSNGTNGVKYDSTSGGEVTGNTIASNGLRPPLPGSKGYNGIEFGIGWAGKGPSGIVMQISNNSISQNTGDGIFIGTGSLNIINNQFYNNWLAVSIAGAGAISIKGNTFDMPLTKTDQEGILINGTYGTPTVTIGGTANGASNTFNNFGAGYPCIHCGSGSLVVACGGNIFVNSAYHQKGCNMTTCPP